MVKSLAFLNQASPASLTLLTKTEGSETRATEPTAEAETRYKGLLSDLCLAMFNLNEFVFLE